MPRPVTDPPLETVLRTGVPPKTWGRFTTMTAAAGKSHGLPPETGVDGKTRCRIGRGRRVERPRRRQRFLLSVTVSRSTPHPHPVNRKPGTCVRSVVGGSRPGVRDGRDVQDGSDPRTDVTRDERLSGRKEIHRWTNRFRIHTNLVCARVDPHSVSVRTDRPLHTPYSDVGHGDLNSFACLHKTCYLVLKRRSPHSP